MSFAIVLVAPEQPENIGFVARSMKCFGLTELIIVGHKSAGDAAYRTGVAAQEILNQVTFYEDSSKALEKALNPFQEAWGFTRRPKNPGQLCEDWWSFLSQNFASSEASLSALSNKRIALVFGRESVGLHKEETLLLTHLLRIESASKTMSLNLSHAITIVLADLQRSKLLGHAKQVAQPKSNANAFTNGFTLEERHKILQQWKRLLQSKGFMHPEKEAATTEYLQQLWQRLNPQKQELDFLQGLLRKSLGD